MKKLHNSNTSIELKKDYDVIVYSDYNKGTIEKVFDSKAKHFLDSKRSNLDIFLSLPSLTIKINNIEYEKLDTKMKKIETGIVTYGRKPVHMYEKGKLIDTIPIYNKDLNEHDFNGAGDSFLCGYIYAVSSGFSKEEAIKIANINAYISVCKFGTYTPSLLELQKEITKAHTTGYIHE
jgi:bifunctional ADP-heptose synthase (sugar kinase/adenylyltransferase)